MGRIKRRRSFCEEVGSEKGWREGHILDTKIVPSSCFLLLGYQHHGDAVQYPSNRRQF